MQPVDLPRIGAHRDRIAMPWQIRSTLRGNPELLAATVGRPAIVSVDTYRRILAETERFLDGAEGPRLPGTASGTGLHAATAYVADMLQHCPATIQGATHGNPTQIVTFERPHPLALTDDDIARALASATPFTPAHTYEAAAIDATTVEGWHYSAKLHGAARVAAAFAWHLDLDPHHVPTALRYGPGAHFVRHVDNYEGSAHHRDLAVSVSAQLSDPDDYRGGTVTYELDGTTWTAPTSRGAVIVFRSDLPHEVAPVTAGTRYATASFLHTHPGR